MKILFFDYKMSIFANRRGRCGKKLKKMQKKLKKVEKFLKKC